VGKTSADIVQRLRRKRSIRKKISGSAERPRLCVFKSTRHIYAQVVDDAAGRTIVAASTMGKEERDGVKELKPIEQAKKIGELIAARCKVAGIEKVVFDRNGFKYHGLVKAVAEGARAGGLQL